MSPERPNRKSVHLNPQIKAKTGKEKFELDLFYSTEQGKKYKVQSKKKKAQGEAFLQNDELNMSQSDVSMGSSMEKDHFLTQREKRVNEFAVAMSQDDNRPISLRLKENHE